LQPSPRAMRARPVASSFCAAVVAFVAATSHVRAFTAGFRREVGRADSRLARRVGSGGHDGSHVVLMRPKAQGFLPDDQVGPREVAPVVPGFSKQGYLFSDYVSKSYPVSEVFARFEGKTPWKFLGEIASTTGDYEEAVLAQWPLLVQHTYYLSRKARFWMTKAHTISFGYGNENQTITTVTTGPLPEGTPPQELRAMLNRCGFRRKNKPKYWRHMNTVRKDLWESKNDAFRKKPHLMHREWNLRVQAHKWYNPDKYKGSYAYFMRKKRGRGLVMGQGPDR